MKRVEGKGRVIAINCLIGAKRERGKKETVRNGIKYWLNSE